jgi:hypothetical protein
MHPHNSVDITTATATTIGSTVPTTRSIQSNYPNQLLNGSLIHLPIGSDGNPTNDDGTPIMIVKRIEFDTCVPNDHGEFQTVMRINNVTFPFILHNVMFHKVGETALLSQKYYLKLYAYDDVTNVAHLTGYTRDPSDGLGPYADMTQSLYESVKEWFYKQ